MKHLSHSPRKQRSRAQTLQSYYLNHIRQKSNALFILSIIIGLLLSCLLSFLLSKTLTKKDDGPQSEQKVITNPSSITLSPDSQQKIYISTNRNLINDIKLLRDLQHYGKQKQYEDFLNELSSKYPENITILRLNAKNYNESGNTNKYFETLKAIAEKARSLDDVTVLAQYLISKEKYQDVIKLVNTLSLEDKKNIYIAESFAYSHLELQNWEPAIRGYSNLVDRSPYEPSYWLGLAKAQENALLVQQALDAYHQTLNLQPDLSIKKLALAGVIRLKSHEYSQLQPN